MRRVEDLGPGVVKLRRAAFVPPGYSSLLYAHLYENASCAFPTSLFKGFKAFMLEPLGLLQQSPSHFQGPLKVPSSPPPCDGMTDMSPSRIQGPLNILSSP